MKYAICPQCGSHLDFGEHCDCEEQREQQSSEKGGERIGSNITAAGGGVSRNDD